VRRAGRVSLPEPRGAWTIGHLRFPRAARLVRAADYRLVFAGPLRVKGRFFVVIARPNGAQPARLGLAISRKQASRAVDRNRLKRIVRESFREHKQTLAGHDCVVLCRNPAKLAGNRELFESLALHWQQIRDQLCATS
jgi:ribonuclease P protein component